MSDIFKKIKNRLTKSADKGLRIIRLDETDSTNTYLRSYHPADGEVMTVATADYQTAGRGQGSNSWESERGKNLLFSILIHPVHVPIARQFLLSECGALALKDAIGKYINNGITLKWPNDIYWNDRKLSGTLIETKISGGHIRDCIFGVGLNVNQTTFRSDAPNPVSMKGIIGHDVDREQLLDDIISSFRKMYDLIVNGDYTDIAALYEESLYRGHGFARYRDKDGDFEAAIVEVEDDGRLILRSHDGVMRSYMFKEVEMIINKQ